MNASNGKTVARELRAQGWSHRRIAKHLGASKSTVVRWVNDDFAERQRERSRQWKQAHPEHREHDRIARAGECEVCGTETRRRSPRCAEHRADITARYDRSLRVRAMWLAGATLREIAEAEGYTSPTAVGVDMTRARNEGWDFPYRHSIRNGKRVAA